MHHTDSVVPSWGEADDPPWRNAIPAAAAVFIWASSSVQIQMPTARTVQLTCQWKYATVFLRSWDARAAQRKAYVSVLQHDLKDTKIQFERIHSHSLDYLSLFQLFYSIRGRCPGKQRVLSRYDDKHWGLSCVDTMLPDGGDAGHLPTAGHRHQEVLYAIPFDRQKLWPIAWRQARVRLL